MKREIKISNGQAVPDAFPERQALMPVWGGIDVPSDEWQRLWREQAQTVLQEDALAYLHIPFCANHCVFCGFYQTSRSILFNKANVSGIERSLNRPKYTCERENKPPRMSPKPPGINPMTKSR